VVRQETSLSSKLDRTFRALPQIFIGVDLRYDLSLIAAHERGRELLGGTGHITDLCRQPKICTLATAGNCTEVSPLKSVTSLSTKPKEHSDSNRQ
jgi:hypothetical protein